MAQPAPEQGLPPNPARVPLGLAIVLAERLRADLGVHAPPPVVAVAAFTVGLGDAVASAGRRLAGTAVQATTAAGRRPASAVVDAGRQVLSQPVIGRAAQPVRRLGSAVLTRAETTTARGRVVAHAARGDAVALLRTQTEGGIAWARDTVLPAFIDDLVGDPKVRELVVEQTHGALSDAVHEVRLRTAGADARLESGVRWLLGALGRHEPAT
ncbi:MAG: hypothetical protein ACRDWI_00460 [Jiangellaceae bacterium]